jgi:CheY-like chemotaxis protein
MSMCAYHLAMVLAVVDDLLFSSKIRSVAAGAGEAVTFVRNAGGVNAACAEHQPRLVLIDLDRDALNPIETITMIRAMPAPVPRIVAFGAHVNVDRLRAAREAGADQAMARSAFVVALPALLGAAVPESRER